MRVTVIPEDRWIRRDDDAVNLAEWSFNDADIHAIQWYDDNGEIEFDGAPKPANRPFTDASLLAPYLEALDAHLASQPEPELED
jgi:hypothetical protein